MEQNIQPRKTNSKVNGARFNPEHIEKKIEELQEKKRKIVQEELKQNVDKFKLMEAYEDCANVIINRQSLKLDVPASAHARTSSLRVASNSHDKEAVTPQMIDDAIKKVDLEKLSGAKADLPYSSTGRAPITEKKTFSYE